MSTWFLAQPGRKSVKSSELVDVSSQRRPAMTSPPDPVEREGLIPRDTDEKPSDAMPQPGFKDFREQAEWWQRTCVFWHGEADKWMAHAMNSSDRAERAEAQVEQLTEEREAYFRDLSWERERHDEARTSWLLMRDRLNGLREACENALSCTEPPGGYDEPWVCYDGEVEAAPWTWLATLVTEALADFESFDQADWAEEEEKRKAERGKFVERAEQAEVQLRRYREALERLGSMEGFEGAGYIADDLSFPARELRARIAFARDALEEGR